jgi:hypothetical protein
MHLIDDLATPALRLNGVRRGVAASFARGPSARSQSASRTRSFRHFCLKHRANWTLCSFAMVLSALLSPIATAQTPPADPVAGRERYELLCQACHGSPPDQRAQLAANNADSLSSAINQVSSMGFLTALLTRRDIENIAAYIGNTSLSQNVLTVGLQGSGRGLVTSSPSGIACGANCATAFAPETLVTLSASPEFGSAFAGWSGACSGQSNRCTLPVSAARTVIARFVRNGSTIDHSGYWVSPEVLGSGAGNLEAGSVVAMTHRADSGQIAKFSQLPAASVSLFGRQFVMMASGQWSNDFGAFLGSVYRLEDVRLSASGELVVVGAAIGEAELRLETADRMQIVYSVGNVREIRTLLRLPAPTPKKPNPR